MNKIIVDSGPLIALFDSSDKYHKRAVDFIKRNKRPLISTTPVITEVVYLLDFHVNAQLDFLEWVYRGGVEIADLKKIDISRIKDLMKKYQNIPMDFADGSVISICERFDTNLVATVDSDFEIYRFKDKRKFDNVFNK